MIKVVFTYRTKNVNLPQLMEKFKQSSDAKFKSDVENLKIEMFKRVDDSYTYIVLDIYYNSYEDFRIRTDFERSQQAWNDIWFNQNNDHEEVSVEVFEVL